MFKSRIHHKEAITTEITEKKCRLGKPRLIIYTDCQAAWMKNRHSLPDAQLLF